MDSIEEKKYDVLVIGAGAAGMRAAIAASVLATEALQSGSVPINARIASIFSGITSDSW